MNRAVINIGLP